MLICKGEAQSAQILCDCLETFVASFGLHANTSKSALYLAGVLEPVQLQIAQVTQLPLGRLPFRYLGVPLTSKRIPATDYDSLVDKMIARICSWISRILSYAARVQLVSVVLQSISSYWCQLFILPRAIIKKVNTIC